MSFGAALRLLRVDAGFGLRELAGLLGVSGAYLSRVENGHDPPPTPDRLADIAAALGVPAGPLVDLAHQTGPAVSGYLSRAPAASALFLEIARRNLGPAEIAKIRAFIDSELPAVRRRRPARLAELVGPSRVVLRLGVEDVEDLVDVAASRLPLPPRTTVRQLAARILDREREAPTALGKGFLAPHALWPGATPAAALITLAAPLDAPTPDGEAVRIAIVLIGPRADPRHLELLARIARLASQGAAADLCAAVTPARALAVLERLESSW